MFVVGNVAAHLGQVGAEKVGVTSPTALAVARAVAGIGAAYFVGKALA